MISDGSLTRARRVTRDALLLAAEVIEAYEPDSDDPGAAALAAVAYMLRREAREREVSRWIDALTSESQRQGLAVDSPKARATIRRIAEEKCP